MYDFYKICEEMTQEDFIRRLEEEIERLKAESEVEQIALCSKEECYLSVGKRFLERMKKNKYGKSNWEEKIKLHK